MMIRRQFAARLLAVSLLGLIAPAVSFADTGVTDAGDTGGLDATDVSDTEMDDADDGTAMDVADTATGDADAADGAVMDAGDDASVDAADVGDAGDTSPPEEDATGDAGDEDATDAGDVPTTDTDVGADATPADVDDAEADVARFYGEISVARRIDDGGVTVAIERTDGDVSREQTTDETGDFSFEDLPLGSYEVEISLENYVTIVETFELAGDREARYTLYPDQDVDVRIRALFDHVDQPPDEVQFELAGERGERVPEGGAIEVADGAAEWTVSELGVGTWRLTASADGFRDVSFAFGATDSEGERQQLDIRLYMPRADIEPPPPDTSGCSCSRESGGGTPSPTPTPGPYSRTLFVLLSLLFSRRLFACYSASRD